MSQETDSTHRAKEGIVICLRDLGDGSSRLIFDDVVADDPAARQRVWRHKVFFTHNAYPNESLDNMELSDEQFQKIGEAVVARLLAINKRVK
ncbi:hypothetical protein ACFPME_05545 [Rhodanobacter umsongensis]|uniref:Uncharacterized protein n=2 Tax=Rhodanobacteraceae TaxID=1775411 RepID=A0ABW0JIX1_9GAMM